MEKPNNAENDVKTGVIYKITNLINGKMYIGQTTQDPLERYGQHKSDAKRRPIGRLHKAINKYKPENFSFEILEICELSNLSEREIYYIALYDSYNKNVGYNMSTGGENGRIGVAPWNKGLTKETSPLIKKMAEKMSGKGNWFYGKKHPPERIEHWRKSKSGELSHSWGKTRPDNAQRNANKVWTEEEKAKISRANSKPIRCIQTGIVYDSVKSCAKKLGLDSNTLHKIIRGKQKHRDGYTFEYVNKENK